ncbi:hypothetical protein ANANG_G00314090 [Anguilla anguilla]|uniref:Coiled-coil domain-containing protein 91 n=1 Tax=Anguilla anguilla TaxID=7936 RepID=A0A9D3LQB4_ANGAN|nr:hypothetical protein ANANG_G00314090 [Anguilla anguilla]
MDDDDDFGGFEAAEGGDGAAQVTVSPAIPWAALSSVPGMKLATGAPPDILMDQQPSYQTDSLEPAPPGTPPEQPQVSPDPAPDSPTTSTTQHAAPAADSPDSTEAREAHSQVQQVVCSLQTQLAASEEEKARIQQDLEEMMAKQARMEALFQKEKGAESDLHRKRYAELQEQHGVSLEDMRKAGHESLGIIVEEFKALTRSAVEQQQEVGEARLQAALEEQRHRCEELMEAQHRRLLDLLDGERDALEEKLRETLSQQAQHHREELEKCMQEEKQRAERAIEAAVQAQEGRLKEAVLEAVQEERRRAERQQAEQRAEWEAERRRDRDSLDQAIRDALTDQRRASKEVLREAVEEERQAGERRLQEATLKVREELMDFMKEQKRLDHVTRKKNLASLELFLSCAQRQLSGLLQDGPPAEEEEEEEEGELERVEKLQLDSPPPLSIHLLLTSSRVVLATIASLNPVRAVV